MAERIEEIIRKHMNDDWVSVEERLPEEPKENPEFEGKKIELYLVTVKGTKYPFRAMWNGKFFTDGWSKCNVIAWRPLQSHTARKGVRENNAIMDDYSCRSNCRRKLYATRGLVLAYYRLLCVACAL